MENNYTVYMHISPNNKKYIGITSQRVDRRWRNGKIYDSYTQCQNELEINRKRISECCNNKREYVIKNDIKYFFELVDTI